MNNTLLSFVIIIIIIAILSLGGYIFVPEINESINNLGVTGTFSGTPNNSGFNPPPTIDFGGVWYYIINNQSDLNYTLFLQGYYDGNCLIVNNDKVSTFDCNSTGINELDGGFASSVYLIIQKVDGGSA